jgi:TatA/E family protein of Tat protein translocase
MVSGDEWVIVILVVLILFGASRLPQIGRSLGEGIREFRSGLRDDSDDDAPEPGPAPRGLSPGNQANGSAP